MGSPGSPPASTAALNLALRERDELRRSLEDARREFDIYKTRSESREEDRESARRKLRDLAEDLRERSERRQVELADAEGRLSKARRKLEDAEGRAADLEEKNAQLADELDVARGKASQLKRAEDTVAAYRRKLEDAGTMSRQVSDLEDQGVGYLRQIVELEGEARKLPGLQRAVEDLKTKLSRAEREIEESEEALRDRGAEVARYRGEAGAAEAAKRMFEEELATVKARLDGPTLGPISPSPDMLGASGGSSNGLTGLGDLSAAREKAVRIGIENDALRGEVEALREFKSMAEEEMTAAAPAGGRLGSEEASGLRAELDSLRGVLRLREAEKAKLSSDKMKLEAYTKKTLSKFQEKYLVALQECKAKLKEKHDKIEALESRSASEKMSQKKEERLLSSTIYELGLAVMQHRLKDRN